MPMPQPNSRMKGPLTQAVHAENLGLPVTKRVYHDSNQYDRPLHEVSVVISLLLMCLLLASVANIKREKFLIFSENSVR